MTAVPLLSVVTVVRDGETAALEEFVARVREWAGSVVGDVVVYDTTAGGLSPDLVERLGISARRGYWDRELGRARNEALVGVRTPWALILDLDETPTGSASRLTRVARGHRDEAALLVEVRSPAGQALFGRLVRGGSEAHNGSECEITASAYTPHRRIGRVETDVLTIARAERADTAAAAPRHLARLLRELRDAQDGPGRAEALLRAAAECRAVGRLGKACELFEQLVALDEPAAAVQAGLERYADLLIGQGAVDAAASVLERLECGDNPAFASWLRIHWHLARGDAAAALTMLRSQGPPAPTAGRRLADDAVVRLRYRLAGQLGADADLLSSLLTLMMVGQEIEGNGKLLLKLWGRRSASDLADVLREAGAEQRDALTKELERTSSAGVQVARHLRAHEITYRTAAVVIARDEARCIERCVASILPWVDEVLVADTGSTDDTVRLAERAGARVVHIEWADDFAAARNAALNAAAADWHVVIDADEVVAGGGRDLQDLHRVAPTHVYSVTVLSSLVIEGVPAVESDRISRILPGDVRYSGAIHEGPSHPYPVVPVAVTFEHDGYEPQQLAGKLPRREAMIRQAVEQDPSDPYLRHQLARNLEAQQDYAGAADAYSAIDRESASHEPWHHVFIVQYAHTLTLLGRPAEALALLSENAERYDESPDFHFVTGDVLIDLAADHPELAGELLPRAAHEFRRCLAIGPVPGLEGHIGERAGVLAQRNLSIVVDTARALGIAVVDADLMPGSQGGSARSTSDGVPAPDGSLDVVMIVKNEERNLGAALSSLSCLRPLLGRICVYDTGSTDGTVELARTYGANVVQGYWDDNYSRARNAAAAMSDAPWLFVVDADERVFADPARLAVELAAADARGEEALYVEAAPVSLESEDADAVSRHWMSARLYRPDLVRYARPVHAELRRVDGSRFTDEWHLDRDIVRIENDGFGVERQQASVQRALHLTSVAHELPADHADRMAVLVDRARARWGAGDMGGARADLRAAINMGSVTTYHRWARQWLVRLEVETGHLDAATTELEALKAVAPTDPYSRWLEAHLRLAQGQADDAARILSGISSVADAIGLTVPDEHVAETFLVAATRAKDDAATALAVHRLALVRGEVELATKAQEVVTRLNAFQG